MNDESVLDEATRPFTLTGGSSAAPGPPALTVLAHPDVQRIGDHAVLTGLLAGSAVELSRLEPIFAPRRGLPRRPLASQRLSRRAGIRFRPISEGGVRIEPIGAELEIFVEGVGLGEGRDVSSDQLERGMTVLLARSICLLLHRIEDLGLDLALEQDGMIGESTGLQRVRLAVRRAASRIDLQTEAEPVLIRGETGTGKELVAGSLHRQSSRSARPAVVVNSATIRGELAASSLFGSVRGAFTGAVDRCGLFREASGGTLVLDEIGFADLEVQQALLRAVENRQISRVGSTRTEGVDVWVVAATDQDLERACEDGRFLGPLLYRLAANEIRIPPLRERREDIPRLFHAFLRRRLEALGCADRLLPDGNGGSWIPAPLVERLVRHSWPGNIRELANSVHQWIDHALDQPRMTLSPELEAKLDAPPLSMGEGPVSGSAAESTSSASPTRAPAIPPMPAPTLAAYVDIDRFDDGQIDAAMERAGFVIAHAAKHLGVRRTALVERVKRHPDLRLAGDLGRRELEQAIEEIGFDPEALALRFRVGKKGLKTRIRKLGLHPDDAEGVEP